MGLSPNQEADQTKHITDWAAKKSHARGSFKVDLIANNLESRCMPLITPLKIGREHF